MARANFVELSEEELAKQEAYDAAYYDLESDAEEDEEAPSAEQDFHKPLQEVVAETRRVTAEPVRTASSTTLKGDVRLEEKAVREGEPLAVTAWKSNRAGRRRLAKQVLAYTRLSETSRKSRGHTITLPKLLARPPGTAFLGAKATKARSYLGNMATETTEVIVDSGSDITLISEACLKAMKDVPRTRAGQRIKLIQVTGSVSIDGFAGIDLFFQTEDGPVHLPVEAYVVKGMSTPFILGNDFQDQFSLSILRKDGNTTLAFGDSGRSIPVENSTSPSLIDENGHAFNILKAAPAEIRRRRGPVPRPIRDIYVRSAALTIIPPETSKLISVTAPFTEKNSELFVERIFTANKTPRTFSQPPTPLLAKLRQIYMWLTSLRNLW